MLKFIDPTRRIAQRALGAQTTVSYDPAYEADDAIHPAITVGNWMTIWQTEAGKFKIDVVIMVGSARSAEGVDVSTLPTDHPSYFHALENAMTMMVTEMIANLCTDEAMALDYKEIEGA